jgi:general nucleoside transport system permease protein
MMTELLASQLFSTPVMTSFISGLLVAAVPLMFAALGETISERAGVINIGLEGMMLIGAYTGFLGAYYGGSTWLGYLTGIAGGVGVALFMILFCVRLGLDQIVIGIALTLVAEGMTSLLQGAQFGTSYPRLGNPWTPSIPLLGRIPVLGPTLFQQNLIVYIGFALVALVAWMLRATSVGLNLRAAGERPEAVDAAGVSVTATRSYAVLATGALAGLGGAFLSVVAAGVFVPFMTNGQGFIAIVIAMLARGKPIWVVVGSLLFGVSFSLLTTLQVAGIHLSTNVVELLPFVAVMAAAILFARRSYLPATLGLPYVRGAR